MSSNEVQPDDRRYRRDLGRRGRHGAPLPGSGGGARPGVGLGQARRPVSRRHAAVAAIDVSSLDAGLVTAMVRLVRFPDAPDDVRVLPTADLAGDRLPSPGEQATMTPRISIANTSGTSARRQCATSLAREMPSWKPPDSELLSTGGEGQSRHRARVQVCGDTRSLPQTKGNRH